jgi:hypothetical protein
MVWVLVLVLLILVGSLDNGVELYILACNAQKWTDIVSLNIRICFDPSVVCIRKNIEAS